MSDQRFLVYAGVVLAPRQKGPAGPRSVQDVAFARICQDSEVRAAQEEAGEEHLNVTTISLNNATELAKLVHVGLISTT